MDAVTDVFISYAREDRETARRLAEQVLAQGYSVWWDRELVPGEAFSETIETTIDAANVVIVLWSATSRKSYWVRDEAAVGRDRNRLVPITLDGEQPPLGFRQLHTIAFASLASDAHVTQAFWSSLAALCGRKAPPIQQEAPLPQTEAAKPRPAPTTRPVAQILQEEKRQRSFVRSFWGTSFIISAILAGALGLIARHTVSNARAGGFIVMLGTFLWMGVALVIGRFLVVIGRRLSKRKSVRYFDQPTIICLLLSIAIGLTILADKSQPSVGDAISMVPLLAGMVFPFFAACSIVIGFARGLSRTTFAAGK